MDVSLVIKQRLEEMGLEQRDLAAAADVTESYISQLLTPDLTLRQIAPWRARAQHPEDAIQNPPVIDPRHATRFVRQQRRDRPPFEFRQLVSAHDPAPAVWKFESHCRRRGNPLYEFMTKPFLICVTVAALTGSAARWAYPPRGTDKSADVKSNHNPTILIQKCNGRVGPRFLGGSQCL